MERLADQDQDQDQDHGHMERLAAKVAEREKAETWMAHGTGAHDSDSLAESAGDKIVSEAESRFQHLRTLPTVPDVRPGEERVAGGDQTRYVGSTLKSRSKSRSTSPMVPVEHVVTHESVRKPQVLVGTNRDFNSLVAEKLRLRREKMHQDPCHVINSDQDQDQDQNHHRDQDRVGSGYIYQGSTYHAPVERLPFSVLSIFCNKPNPNCCSLLHLVRQKQLALKTVPDDADESKVDTLHSAPTSAERKLWAEPDPKQHTVRLINHPRFHQQSPLVASTWRRREDKAPTRLKGETGCVVPAIYGKIAGEMGLPSSNDTGKLPQQFVVAAHQALSKTRIPDDIIKPVTADVLEAIEEARFKAEALPEGAHKTYKLRVLEKEAREARRGAVAEEVRLLVAEREALVRRAEASEANALALETRGAGR